MGTRTVCLWGLGLAVLTLTGNIGSAGGQQRDPEVRDREARDRAVQGEVQRAAQAGVPVVSDRQLATWLMIDNRGEIELARFAQEQAGSEEVRAFARQMAKEHSQFVQKLQELVGTNDAGGVDETRPATRREQKQDRSERRRDGEAAGREATDETEAASADDGPSNRRRRVDLRDQADEDATGGTIPAPFHGKTAGVPTGLLALKQELGIKHVESVKAALKGKQGADFDIAYVNQQILAHQRMLDTLQVFQRHAGSDELKQLVKQGEQTTREHLQTARNLFRQVDRREN